MNHTTHIAAAAAAIAALTIPAVASAHTATVTCDPTTGVVVTASNQDRNPTWVFTDTTVTVTWVDGFTRTITLPPPCQLPPPVPTPQPVPTPHPLPVPEPVVIPPVTCADLIARYPGAGPVRRAQWGCPAEPVKRRTVKPKPPQRVVTCSFVIRHYRGTARNRMVTRHGLPATCGRPYNPPVAG